MPGRHLEGGHGASEPAGGTRKHEDSLLELDARAPGPRTSRPTAKFGQEVELAPPGTWCATTSCPSTTITTVTQHKSLSKELAFLSKEQSDSRTLVVKWEAAPGKPSRKQLRTASCQFSVAGHAAESPERVGSGHGSGGTAQNTATIPTPAPAWVRQSTVCLLGSFKHRSDMGSGDGKGGWSA